MNSKLPYKIGTRGSLLALTQCTLIKNEIEARTGKSFELNTIKTQGDQIQDKPLWQLDGKDFFTKELDHALLKKDVDLVVHSYKDLGSERPVGINLQTITKRSFAHDILLMKKSVSQDLKNRERLIIGTSSPRRTVNLTNHLADFLPFGDNITIECKSVRGNVNSRIEKLKNENYDGIALALAGIERLANKEESRKILEGLLTDLDFIILPQIYFPSAASQGSLAIECLDDAEGELKETLASVHDELTASEMKRERAAFKSYGGGCHLAVGIFVKKIQGFYLHLHRGSADEKPVFRRELEGADYSGLANKKGYQVYGQYDFLINKEKLDFNAGENNLYVTSSHCFHDLNDNHSSLWAAGNRTFKKLVEKGYWVSGSSEGLGHELINDFKSSKAINIMLKKKEWSVLSHNEAESSVGDTVSCYKHVLNQEVDKQHEENLLNAEAIFWASSIQYESYLKKYPQLKDKIHCCGLGKTYTKIKELNPNIIACVGMSHFSELTK